MTDLEERIRASLLADAALAPEAPAGFTPLGGDSPSRVARPTRYRSLVAVAALLAIVVGAFVVGQRRTSRVSTTDRGDAVVAYPTAVPEGYELTSARVAAPRSTLQLPADARSATLRRGGDLVNVLWFPYERADFAMTGRPIDVGLGAVATITSEAPLSIDIRMPGLSAALHSTSSPLNVLQGLAAEMGTSRSIDIRGWKVVDTSMSAALSEIEYLKVLLDATASDITISAFRRSTLPDGGEPIDVNGARGVLLGQWLTWQFDAATQLQIRGPADSESALDREALLRLARGVVLASSDDSARVASVPDSIRAALESPIEYRSLDARLDPAISSWLIGVHSVGAWCPGLQVQEGAVGSQGFVGPPCSIGDARLVGDQMVGLLPPGTAAAHFEIGSQGPPVPAVLVVAPDGNVFAYAPAIAASGADSVRIVADSTG